MCLQGDTVLLNLQGVRVAVDRCLAPIVKALNDGSVETVASCCGHGFRPGRVELRDGRALFVAPDYKVAQRIDDGLCDWGFRKITGEPCGPTFPGRTTMKTEHLHDEVDQLLHDAESADAGAEFAGMMARTQPGNPQHATSATELAAKRDRLITTALRLDPERTAPAWEETTLSIPSQDPAAGGSE